MKVAIYIRTSTKDQNPENQLKNCESINNYGEYEKFEDKQSAWNDKKEREDFERLKQLIKINRFEHLIVWDLDRLFRNRKNLIAFFELSKIYNCKIHSFRQQWLEDLHKIPAPFNEIMFNLMLQIMGWLAEEESNKKSERVKIAVRREEGKDTKSYKGNKWGRKELSKSTIEMVLELNRNGHSIRKIADEVKYWDNSNHQKNISKSAVHKILNEFKALNVRNEVVH